MAPADSKGRTTDIAMSHSDTPNLKQTKKQDKLKKEARQPVLLQWKDREMADDISRLFVNDSKAKADTGGGDVEMKDQCGTG
jgi:hypothetical protein